MLKSSLDLDGAFDGIIKRSYPYLIFPQQEFRDELAQQLDSLCQYYRERNDTAFKGRIEVINRMLDQAFFDDLTELKIHYFESEQNTFHERFLKIEERLSRLESSGRSVGKRRRPKKEDINENKTGEKPSKIEIENQISEIIRVFGAPQELTPQELTPQELTPQELIKAPIEVNEDSDKSETQIHNRDIIRNCLRSSNVPLTSNEISNITGLPLDKVVTAIGGLFTTWDKHHIKRDYIVREAPYGNTMRNLRFTAYSWIENV